jgi:hypothetical protein
MASTIMVDSAADARTLVAQVSAALGAPPAAWARYLGTGGAGATPLGAAEASALQDAGIGILPVYNDSPINGGTQGTYALGQADAAQAVRQATALGVPAGTYICCDIEASALGLLTGDYLAGWADAMRGSSYGGAGIVYANLADPRFGQALDAALARSPANVGRMGFWLASWLTSDSPDAPAAPEWSAAYGPEQLPWQAPEQAQVWAWQYAGGALGGTVDLSVIRLPLPAPGGLWTASDGPVAPPADPANTPDPWAAAAWAKAAAAGVLDGTRPRDPLTREEAAVVLDRLKLLG